MSHPDPRALLRRKDLKEDMQKFDLIIIGGGPAGYKAAELAAENFEVALFERGEPGGVCLNAGCVPTKSLLHIAKEIYAAKSLTEFGLEPLTGDIDTVKLMKKKERHIRTLRAGVASALRNAGVKVYAERAEIAGRRGDEFVVRAPSGEYAAKRLLIAAGSEPVMPPIQGLEEGLKSGFVTDSTGALDIKRIPRKYVVIGGGVIGAEMASLYAMLGAEVTLFEATDSLTAVPDTDMKALLKKSLERLGVKVHLSSFVRGIAPGLVTATSDGKGIEAEADEVLVCAGRRPVLSGYGLETLSPAVAAGIVTDEYMRTSVPGMWAAGDVNGKMMLAHKAYREAETAVEDMLGKSEKIRYDTVPQVVYTIPEFASVGVTEGEGLVVKKVPAAYSARYVAESDTKDGFIKFVIDPSTNTLKGAFAAVPYASEIIGTLAAFIQLKTPISQINTLSFPHPSVAELISLPKR